MQEEMNGQDWKARAEKLEARLLETQKQLAQSQVDLENAEAQAEALRELLEVVTDAKESLENATFWKMTLPLRKASTALKRLLRREVREGDLWTLSSLERKKETGRIFPPELSFAVVVFLEAGKGRFLRQMIQSLEHQTCGKWKLYLIQMEEYLAPAVEKTAKHSAEKDERIVFYPFSERNRVELLEERYVCFADADDCLHPSALYTCGTVIETEHPDFLYSDDLVFNKEPRGGGLPCHKPDYAPDYLRNYNYIGSFFLCAGALLKAAGGWREGGASYRMYDLVLRLTEQAEKLVRIPRLLYFIRKKPGKAETEGELRALREALDRGEIPGTAEPGTAAGTYRIRYQIQGNPKVSILIPNKDEAGTLKTCLESIFARTTYENYEIIIIENNSSTPEIFSYYRELEQNPRVKTVVWENGFNYSAINNFGAEQASGEYLVLLNNDMEIISGDWLQEMLMYAQRWDVGAVGAKLYYPDRTIQHAGVILGIGGAAGHAHKYFKGEETGYANRLITVQNYSAVTAACVMIPARVYRQVGGLDETFQVAFNDVDLCLRIRKEGYRIVYTPYAEAYHYESKSRGADDTPEKRNRALGEVGLLRTRWKAELKAGDEYYNPNLSLDREDFSLRKYDKQYRRP